MDVMLAYTYTDETSTAYWQCKLASGLNGTKSPGIQILPRYW